MILYPPAAFPIKPLLIMQGMPKSASGNEVTRPDSSGKPHQRFSFGSDGGDGVQLVFFVCFSLFFKRRPSKTCFTPC